MESGKQERTEPSNMRKTTEKGIETLLIWKRAIAFAVEVCTNVIILLPKYEKWVLANQLRRSVQSIPGNIAEGYGRYYYQESIRYCYLARGSLEETFSHLTLAHELGYLPVEIFQRSVNEIHELRRMLNGYISFLKKEKRGENEPGAGMPIRVEHGSLSPSQNTDPWYLIPVP